MAIYFDLACILSIAIKIVALTDAWHGAHLLSADLGASTQTLSRRFKQLERDLVPVQVGFAYAMKMMTGC